MPVILHVLLVGPDLAGKTTFMHDMLGEEGLCAGSKSIRIIPILTDYTVGSELLTAASSDPELYHLPYQCKVMAHQLRTLREARAEASADTEHDVVIILEERGSMDPAVVCRPENSDVQPDAIRVLGPFQEFMGELLSGVPYLPPPDAVICVDAPRELIMHRWRREQGKYDCGAEANAKALDYVERALTTWSRAYDANPWCAKHVFRVWNGCAIRDDVTLQKVKHQRFHDVVRCLV